MFFSITVLMILSFCTGTFGNDGVLVCTIGVYWNSEIQFLDALNDLHCTIKALFPCEDPFKCASHTITREMWEIANFPEVDETARTDHYPDCMNDRECMMYSMWKYTKSLREIDCDRDIFENIDRVLVLLAKGPNCRGKNIIKLEDVKRYNVCAKEKKIVGISLNSIQNKPKAKG